MMFASRIIVPDQDNIARGGRLARPSGAQHTVEHVPHRQQILQRAQSPRCRRPDPTTLQIGPRRRNEHPAAVRQHQQQLEPAMPAHPPDQLKRAAFQRVPRARNPDRRREPIEMGSVSCDRSITPVAIGQPLRRAVG